jgi:hypothetical protein
MSKDSGRSWSGCPYQAGEMAAFMVSIVIRASPEVRTRVRDPG